MAMLGCEGQSLPGHPAACFVQPAKAAMPHLHVEAEAGHLSARPTAAAIGSPGEIGGKETNDARDEGDPDEGAGGEKKNGGGLLLRTQAARGSGWEGSGGRERVNQMLTPCHVMITLEMTQKVRPSPATRTRPPAGRTTTTLTRTLRPPVYA